MPIIRTFMFLPFSLRIFAASIRYLCPLYGSILAIMPTTKSSLLNPYFSLVSLFSSSVQGFTASTPLRRTIIFFSLIPPSVRLSFAASATAIILSAKYSFTDLFKNFPMPRLIFLLTGNTECLVYITFFPQNLAAILPLKLPWV